MDFVITLLEFATLSNLVFLLIGVVLGLFLFKILSSPNRDLAIYLIVVFLEALDKFDLKDLDKKELLMYILKKLSEWNGNTEGIENEIKKVFQQVLEEEH